MGFFDFLRKASSAGAAPKKDDPGSLSGSELYNRADAADMGDVQAKVDFAYFMETGKYVEADVTYARQLVEEAARAGNAEANYKMYEAYAKGRYRTRRDEERARTYLFTAVRGEFYDAVKELKQLAANGDAKAKEVYDSLEI